MTRFVGDWSNHDHGRGAVNFAAMRSDGIEGGWHKSSDGLRFYTDPYYASAIGRMRTAFRGGPVGAYHVLWGNRSISDQIAWWFEILDATSPGWRTDPTFQLVTDNEPFGYNVPPTIAQVDEAGDIIRQRVGKTTLAYCPAWHYGGELASLRYPLIGSNYGSNPVSWYPRAYPGDGSPRWGRAAILQYGSAVTMGGQPICDVNAVRDPQVWGVLTAGGAPAGTTTGGDELMAAVSGDDAKAVVQAAHAINAWVQGVRDVPEGTIEPPKWQAAAENWQAQTSATLQGLTAVLNNLLALLTTSGGNAEAAAVIAHIDAGLASVRDAESATVTALQETIAGLRQDLHAMRGQIAAGAQAEADALAPQG